MKKTLAAFAALAVLGVAACGGGGSSTTPTPAATIAPSSSPSIAPTIAPTAAPTQVPLSMRVIGGAPLTATAAQLSNAKRGAQTKTLAQGVENGLPILVESSGMVAAWAGDQAVWVTNAQTSADIPETSGTITPSGNLPITNPGFTPLSCLGQVSAVCAVHPTGWTFGTSSANGKPIGKQTITIAFSDGTTGATSDYVYNGWNLACNTGWAYVGGVPVAQATRATSDVYADCVAGNVVFPRGAVLYSNPQADQYNNYATIMPTATAAILMSSLFTNASIPSITAGQVFGIITQDGGVAKVYMGSGVSTSPLALNSAVTGLSLHANPDGSYAF